MDKLHPGPLPSYFPQRQLTAADRTGERVLTAAAGGGGESMTVDPRVGPRDPEQRHHGRVGGPEVYQ